MCDLICPPNIQKGGITVVEMGADFFYAEQLYTSLRSDGFKIIGQTT